MTDMLMLLLLVGGAYYLVQSGKLNELLSGAGLPPVPFGPGGGGTPSGGGGGGGGRQGTVTGTKIYPDASPPHSCTNTSDGGKEQGGDRREPQIACGFNFLNTEATAYVNYHNIKDTLSVKLRGPKHGGSTPESDMCNNIHYFGLGGGSAAFGKQAGHTAEYCEGGPSVSIPANQWVGVKAIEWNTGNGVHLESWVESPEGSGWKQVASADDNGNLGNCNGPAKSAYTKSPCAGNQPVSIGFRVDGLKGGGDVQFKNLSVREIAVPSAAKRSAYTNSYIAQRYYYPHALTRLSNV